MNEQPEENEEQGELNTPLEGVPSNESDTISETEPSPVIATPEIPEEIKGLMDTAEQIRAELRKVIVGQEELFDLLLISLFTKGHVLLEGVPGIAKTMAASMFSKSIDADFSRIQFTPDLMPSDIVGTNIFNVKTSDFQFKKGPVFTDILLVDEINRAPAKTQSAMFEVMQERQVTVDGVTYPMGDAYMVIATQNPIDQEGTYKLPEAQLDRFLFKIVLEHPSMEDEIKILQRFQTDFDSKLTKTVNSVLKISDIPKYQSVVENVHIGEDMLKYIAEIVHSTRNNGDIYLGASPRASLAIMKAAKARAALSGRAFVTPDDVRDVTYYVLNHRIILAPERELEGADVKDVVEEVIEKIEVPR